MAKSKKKFGKNVSANAKAQKNKGSSYGYLLLPNGVSVFKETPDSKVKLDFMPYEVTDPMHLDRDDEREIAIPGELWYKKPFYIHRIGADNDRVVCLKTIGKKCPVCERRAELIKEGASKEDIAQLKPSLRNLYVVIPIGHKEYEEAPHIWDISNFNFQKMLNEELDEDEDQGVFPDLEEGKTLRIRFSEDSVGTTKFATASRIDFDERDEAYDEDILDDVPNLDEVLVIPTYKQLEAKLFEYPDVDEDADEEEEDERPAKSSRKKKSEASAKKKKRPVKEEEDDEDEPGDPEPDEDEPDEDACIACEGTGKNSKGNTCRICKGTGKRPVKDEEQEEEQDEDEPEPKKGKKGKKGRREKEEPEPKGKKGKKGKCAFGHVFGTDCEEFDECFDDCEVFDECLAAKEDE